MRDTRESIFSYEKGNGIAFRCPVLAKMIAYILLSVFALSFSAASAVGVIVLSVALSFASGIAFASLFSDIRQALRYSLLIMASDLVSYAVSKKPWGGIAPSDFSLIMILRTLALISLSSLFFRTTGFYRIWDALRAIEDSLPKKKSRRRSGDGVGFSGSFALFVSFIPKIFRAWEITRDAYLARGGKMSVRAIAVIFPALIRSAMASAGRTFDSFRSRGAGNR